MRKQLLDESGRVASDKFEPKIIERRNGKMFLEVRARILELFEPFSGRCRAQAEPVFASEFYTKRDRRTGKRENRKKISLKIESNFHS